MLSVPGRNPLGWRKQHGTTRYHRKVRHDMCNKVVTSKKQKTKGKTNTEPNEKQSERKRNKRKEN